MKIVYAPKHYGHGGAMELMFNRMVPMFDRPERMEKVLEQLRACGYPAPFEPEEFTLEALYRVHDAAYVNFLMTAHDRWEKEVGDGRFARPPCPSVAARRCAIQENRHGIQNLLGGETCPTQHIAEIFLILRSATVLTPSATPKVINWAGNLQIYWVSHHIWLWLAAQA